jgi:carboxyl-terminal processing protease
MARRIPALWLILVLLGSIVGFGAAPEKPPKESKPPEESKPPKEDYYELYTILVDAIDQVERNYVKEYGRRELIEAAIEGVLDKLDPYSAYINPDEISRFRGTVESEFGGIGIQLAPNPRQLTIFSPLVGTPAYRAGLLAGDRIVEIEGKSTQGMRMEEVIRLLKGKPKTKVRLAVIHLGKKEKVEVTITRQIIHVDTVLGDRRKEDDAWDFMLKPEEHIGYVRITAFSRDTARPELQTVLEQLRSDGLQGLILDLRFNPGGLLTSAIEASDLFISKGRIVSTKGRNSPERAWDAKKEGTFEGFPMVVLVNRYSASASEIVSACLQDHKRAVIMGERTWGKGSVQNVIELAGGESLLKLTTASYRRPSGKNIHRFYGAKEGDDQQWGVTPDKGFDLRLSDAEMGSLIHQRRQRDVVQPKPDKPKPDEPKPDEPKPDKPKPDEIEQPDQPEEKPAESGEGDQQQPQPEDDPEQPAEEAPQAEDEAADEAAESDNGAEEEPFVDRQLQKAVDYLTEKLARAE